MKILICDDHAIFRAGVRTVLEGLDMGVELFEAGDADDVVETALSGGAELVLPAGGLGPMPILRPRAQTQAEMPISPDLTVLLSRLVRDPRVPVTSKMIALLGVAYALSPIDLIPVAFFGPIGLVDDLLVVSAALSKLVNEVHPDVVRSHWPGRGDALHAIQQASGWSADFLRNTIGANVKNFFRPQAR